MEAKVVVSYSYPLKPSGAAKRFASNFRTRLIAVTDFE
jgi:hypothetical protein